jgi:predicted Rossmann fold nucleotide-binding protein DprA/Smf involved in DNA uptake
MPESISLSFTGTRAGMTREQLLGLEALLHDIKPDEVHHGGCIGADEQFHDMVLQKTQARIYIHPCNLSTSYKFHVLPQTRIVILSEKPSLSRNQDIVNCGHAIVACPETRDEIIRSGTWSTVRYAKRINKPLVILYPDVGSFGLHATLTKLGL